MAEDRYERGVCNERTGFLFKHACSGPAADTCDRCKKPVCGEHSHQINAELLCTTCGKSQLKQERHAGESRARQRDRGYDDPYFYDDHYYSGYGRYRSGWGSHYYGGYHGRTSRAHDENDFTEADSENLVHSGDETFEEDMGES